MSDIPDPTTTWRGVFSDYWDAYGDFVRRARPWAILGFGYSMYIPLSQDPMLQTIGGVIGTICFAFAYHYNSFSL